MYPVLHVKDNGTQTEISDKDFQPQHQTSVASIVCVCVCAAGSLQLSLFLYILIPENKRKEKKMAQGFLKKGKPSTASGKAKRLVFFFFFYFFRPLPTAIQTCLHKLYYAILPYTTIISPYRQIILTININAISPAALGPKPGPRQIAPKKNNLVKQQKMTRVRPSIHPSNTPDFLDRKHTCTQSIRKEDEGANGVETHGWIHGEDGAESCGQGGAFGDVGGWEEG